jgi:hypothetical protein
MKRNTGALAACKWYKASTIPVDFGYTYPDSKPGETFRRRGVELPRFTEPPDGDQKRMNEIDAFGDAMNEAARAGYRRSIVFRAAAVSWAAVKYPAYPMEIGLAAAAATARGASYTARAASASLAAARAAATDAVAVLSVSQFCDIHYAATLDNPVICLALWERPDSEMVQAPTGWSASGV